MRSQYLLYETNKKRVIQWPEPPWPVQEFSAHAVAQWLSTSKKILICSPILIQSFNQGKFHRTLLSVAHSKNAHFSCDMVFRISGPCCSEVVMQHIFQSTNSSSTLLFLHRATFMSKSPDPIPSQVKWGWLVIVYIWALCRHDDKIFSCRWESLSLSWIVTKLFTFIKNSRQPC